MSKLRSCVVAAAGLLGMFLAAPAFAEKPMNVLFITADDLGLQLSCYGETLIETPNLDRLAAGGVQFNIAYVAQASCSPSRSAMFTGLHTHATGQFGLTNSGLSLHPELRGRTIPNLLKKAGYRTGIIGKLHVAPEDSFQWDSRSKVNTRDVKSVAERVRGFFAADAGKPFFMMVNYSDPHAWRESRKSPDWSFPPQWFGLPENPLPPSEKTIFPFQQIDTEAMRVRTAGYYNAVQRLDDGIGMLMQALEETGHADDTLVIFVGDHGPPFCRGKTTVYEAGLRIPFLVCWPGVSKPMKTDAMVSTIDVLPTILDATGVEKPAAMHGRSLRPVLQERDAEWRKYLVGEFHFHGRHPFYPRRAIRDHRYKLIHNLLAGKAKPNTGIDGDPAFKTAMTDAYEGTDVGRAFRTFAHPPEFELYDLEKDPVEFHNLAGRDEVADIEKRLKEALLEYRRETSDPFLKDSEILRMIRYAAGKE